MWKQNGNEVIVIKVLNNKEILIKRTKNIPKKLKTVVNALKVLKDKDLLTLETK